MSVDNEKMLVSVIVPVYKVEKYLHACVDSILQQTYSNLDVILVDDGSPDACPTICDEYAAKDVRVRVIHKENGGVSSARNMGIECALGEWIAFVDSDDVIAPMFIETLVCEATDKTVVPFVGFVRFVDSAPDIVCGEKRTIVAHTFKEYTTFHGGGFPCGKLYNLDVIRKNHLRFDTTLAYLEDALWNCLYFCCVSKGICIDQNLYCYRNTEGSLTSRCSDYKWVISCWIHARNASLDSFSQPLASIVQARLKEFYRCCNNNIVAEWIQAKISYKEFRSIYMAARVVTDEMVARQVWGTEYRLQNAAPWLYFGAYRTIMKLRNMLKK